MLFRNKNVRFVIGDLRPQGASRLDKPGAAPRLPRTRRFVLLAGLSLLAVFLGLGVRHAIVQAGSISAQHPEFGRHDSTENTLIVWAGDKAHVAPDFITVIDFDPRSPQYGKVLRTLPLTGPSAIGNEPHHVGLSADGKTFVVGGLLSVLRGQDQVFFFDVSHPRAPQFIRSDNPPGASIADEFDSLSNGGFFGTFMGSPDGANPGRLVEYDANQNFVQAWPVNP